MLEAEDENIQLKQFGIYWEGGVKSVNTLVVLILLLALLGVLQLI